ncbi:MAG: DUF4340 domain-containing protein [SAR202 cluster bacterium]|nr:DUF4340 domain-containing protein [SAR202 cluster bacterium]|tara:strand:+ start:3274 stop:4236 length:963 start_codon:yes stop_codon:yes gene_type:complete
MIKRYILIILAILFVSVLGFLSTYDPQDSANVFSANPETNTDNIDEISFSAFGAQALLVKKDSKWTINSYPVYEPMLKTLWDSISLLDTAVLNSINPDNHPQMGVTPENGTSVKLYAKEELIEELIVGDTKYAPIGENVYAPYSDRVKRCYFRRPNDDNVYSIHCPISDIFTADIGSWIDPTICKVPTDKISSITFMYPDQTFSLVEVGQSQYQVTDGSTSYEANLSVAINFQFKFQNFLAEGFISEEEISNVLEKDPNVVIRIDTKAGSGILPITLLFYEYVDGIYYVRNSADDYAFAIGPQTASEIFLRINDLKNTNQ